MINDDLRSGRLTWQDITDEETSGTQRTNCPEHTPNLCNIETMLAGKGCTIVVGPGSAILIDNSGEKAPQSMSDLDINCIEATCLSCGEHFDDCDCPAYSMGVLDIEWQNQQEEPS